jgi:glycosyltransferase involved in cell wall biosynthesis
VLFNPFLGRLVTKISSRLSIQPAAPTVLVLCDFAHIEGGATKVAIDQAILLAESGVRVIFMAAVGPVDARFAASQVEVICLGQRTLLDAGRSPRVLMQTMWNRTAYLRTYRLLLSLDRNNTIIHLHNSTKALSASPVAAAHHLGFRVVCTLHDFFSACPNGAFFDYARQAPCQRVALSFDCITARCDKRHTAHKVFRVARSVAQRAAGSFPKSVTDYIVLSTRSVAVLRRYLPAESRFHSLKNPIQIARTPPAPVAANRMIVCVGRLDQEKGSLLLANAAVAMGLDIVFVGDGPLREALVGRPGITVTGWLASQEVVQWLDRARCLVFPSLWYETYGLVVEEAAARGVPAIVSDVTAAAERVVDGVTGWHFRSGDFDSLQSRLALTLDDDRIAAAGQAAYERFWQDASSTDGHVEALIDIYRSVLNGAKTVVPAT